MIPFRRLNLSFGYLNKKSMIVSIQKKLTYLFFIVILASSCVMNNRMTSPQTLDKEERIFTYGLVLEPLARDNYDESVFGFQPIVGYRSGIGSRQEIGINLYGFYTPGLTFDWKYKYIEKNNFILSGDIAAFTGFVRPTGFQYDLLFGNRGLYGVAGLNYEIDHFNTNKPSWVLGIGSDFDKYIKGGFQISFMQSFPEFYSDGSKKNPFMTISVGVKFDFLNVKRKYRDF